MVEDKGGRMNNQQLQEAIDKTRAFLSTQIDSKSTPSFEAKRHSVEALAKLEKIQVTRAGMITQPTLQLKEKNT